ncbi:MAG: hypothetical protein VB858_11490, partial [Planctomycetaceae bacterium]
VRPPPEATSWLTPAVSTEEKISLPNSVPRRLILKSLPALPAATSGFRLRSVCRASDAGGRTGIVGVTRGSADLAVPQAGDGFRCGTGYLFQTGPTEVGLLCNLRIEGYPVSDFEAGVDAMISDEPEKIASAESVPVNRTVKYADRVTGSGELGSSMVSKMRLSRMVSDGLTAVCILMRGRGSVSVRLSTSR